MTECYKHRYVEQRRDQGGYWFRCIYCGKEIFGQLSTRSKQ